MPIKIIVGLGNPGSKYEKTRHNVGFETIAMLADERNSGWGFENRFNALVSKLRHEDCRILAMPQGYMNNSGMSVRAMLDFYKFTPDELLVVSDDFSLPLGTLRLRKAGSDGGHNGLASIIEHIGSSGFPRLKLGIGPVPPYFDPADFVLSKFSKEEIQIVEKMKVDAVQVIKTVFSDGWETAVSKLPGKVVSDK